MFSKYKLPKLTAIILILTNTFVFASKKSERIDLLIKTGSYKEIRKEFYKDELFYKTKLGKTKDNLLQKALEYDRELKIIKLIKTSGIKISAKNKEKRNALSFACQYTSDEEVFNFILKKTGSPKKIVKLALIADKNGKTPLDYAQENKSKTAYRILSEHIKEQTLKNNEEEVSQPEEEIQEYTEEETNEQEIEEYKAPEYDVLIPSIKVSQDKEEEIDEQTEQPQENSNTDENTEIEENPEIVQEQTEPAAIIEEQEENTENQNEQPQNIEEKPIEETESKKEIVLPITPERYKKVYLYDYAPLQEELKIEAEETEEFVKIAQPNEKDKKGQTLLMKAVKASNDWEVKSLIKSGADVNIKDNDGWTALMYAVRYQNNIEFIDLLIKNGADIEAKNKYGSNALQIAAAFSQNPEIVKRLLSSYNAGSNDIFKAFILAITSDTGSTEAQTAKLKIFIDSGITLNRFIEGKTPLMYAAEFATSINIIQLLIDNGAIVTIRNSEGKTAFDFAELNTHLERNSAYWSLNTR